MRESVTPTTELVARLRETPVSMARIATLLDGLDQDGRVAAVRALGRSSQRRLFEAADGYASLRLSDLVPPAMPDLAPVRHFGRNTLPLFTRFEKRFCRPSGADPEKPDALYGFNFEPYPALSRLIGPGYFVAVGDPARPEVRIDYCRVPPSSASERPADWPPVRSNEAGLSRFVYGFMIDTLRRVSERVTIGSAARRGRDLGSWFVLCREA